jgi:hypothetical protein
MKFRGLTVRELGLLVMYDSAGMTEWHGTRIQGASPYDIEMRLRQGVGGVGGFKKSSCYAQSKKLEAEGYLYSTTLGGPPSDEADPSRAKRVAESKTKKVAESKTFYSVTEQGRKLVEDWLRTPCAIPAIDTEIEIRLRGGGSGLGDRHELLLDSFEPLRNGLTARAVALENAAAQLKPHDDVTIGLEIDYLLAVTHAQRKWLEKALISLRRSVAREERDRKRRDAQRQKLVTQANRTVKGWS